MALMTQLNTRIDAEAKRQGDAVFARAGLTPSQVVRAVWKNAAETQEVPACVLPQGDATLQQQLSAIARGATLVGRMTREMSLALRADVQPFDYTATTLRDVFYIVQRRVRAQAIADGFDVKNLSFALIAWACAQTMTEIAVAAGQALPECSLA